MSYALGKKIQFIQSWRTYRVGDVIEQGFYVDLESLVQLGVAVEVKGGEAETPARPAKFAHKAAATVAAGSKRLFS